MLAKVRHPGAMIMGRTSRNAGRNTEGWRRRRVLALVASVAVVAACAPTTTTAGSGPTRSQLEYVKRTAFYEQARADADFIAGGLSQPILDFTVEGTPPSIFVNWFVPDGQAAALTVWLWQ